MAKKRMIDGAFRITEAFGMLSYRQRDLWYGLISTADDQGRMIGHAAYVRSQSWPYDDIPLSEVSKDLEALEQAGFILIYTANESKYIQILKWHEQQREATWLAASELPAPDGWVDHARYHGKNGNIILLNWETRDEPQSMPCKQEVSTLSESYLGATYPSTSELPTHLPTQLPRLNDDDNEDDNEDEDEKENINSFPCGNECELRSRVGEKTKKTKSDSNPENSKTDRYLNPSEEISAKRREKQSALSAEFRENSSTNKTDRQVTGKLDPAGITSKPKQTDLPQGSTGKLPASYDDVEKSEPDPLKPFGKNRELAEAFMTASGLKPVGKEHGLWNSALKQIAEAGITPEEIPRIVSYMRRENLTIGSPLSILRIGRDLKASGKINDTGSGKSTKTTNERRKTLVELMAEQEAAERAEAEANAKIIDGTFTDIRSGPVYGGLQLTGGFRQ